MTLAPPDFKVHNTFDKLILHEGILSQKITFFWENFSFFVIFSCHLQSQYLIKRKQIPCHLPRQYLTFFEEILAFFWYFHVIYKGNIWWFLVFFLFENSENFKKFSKKNNQSKHQCIYEKCAIPCGKHLYKTQARWSFTFKNIKFGDTYTNVDYRL